MQISFYRVDVSADQPLKGNPIAAEKDLGLL